MKIKTIANKLRYTFFSQFFENTGVDSPDYIIQDSTKPVHILIVRPNGRLGNLLLVTPLLQEIQATFPNAKIDLFVKGGLAPILFQNYKQIESYIKLPGRPFSNLIEYMMRWTDFRKVTYDMVISTASKSSSGKIAVKISRSKYKYFGLIDEQMENEISDYRHFGKFAVYNFRKYIHIPPQDRASKPIPKLSIQLDQSESENGKLLLDTLVQDPTKKTIGIYTFATGDKCLKEDWWIPFYEKLQQQFPSYNILEVLPKENVSQINFKSNSYYSTNIRELTAVLSHLAVFVTADCGIMHLASATNTPIVSLFSVTSIDLYAPYNSPKSKAIYVNEHSQEEIITLVADAL